MPASAQAWALSRRNRPGAGLQGGLTPFACREAAEEWGKRTGVDQAWGAAAEIERSRALTGSRPARISAWSALM